MATLTAWSVADFPNNVILSASQTGNGDSTNVADRGGHVLNAALIHIGTVAGGSPTCTYTILGSADNSHWFNVAYADSATPTTYVVTTFAITSTTDAYKIVQAGLPWRYLKLNYSANTNITNSVDVTVF